MKFKLLTNKKGKATIVPVASDDPRRGISLSADEIRAGQYEREMMRISDDGSKSSIAPNRNSGIKFKKGKNKAVFMPERHMKDRNAARPSGKNSRQQ